MSYVVLIRPAVSLEGAQTSECISVDVLKIARRTPATNSYSIIVFIAGSKLQPIREDVFVILPDKRPSVPAEKMTQLVTIPTSWVLERMLWVCFCKSNQSKPFHKKRWVDKGDDLSELNVSNIDIFLFRHGYVSFLLLNIVASDFCSLVLVKIIYFIECYKNVTNQSPILTISNTLRRVGENRCWAIEESSIYDKFSFFPHLINIRSFRNFFSF